MVHPSIKITIAAYSEKMVRNKTLIKEQCNDQQHTTFKKIEHVVIWEFRIHCSCTY